MKNKILVKSIEDLPNAKEITNLEAGLYVAADGPAVVATVKENNIFSRSQQALRFTFAMKC